MILLLWKYIQGYVVIKIKGYSPERFINLCANNNIYIWNIKKDSDGYIFSISGKAFFMLSPIAKKTKCRVKIIKKVGLPFKFNKLKKRKYFILGLLLSGIFVISLSFFIWRIEIEGNKVYTTEEILLYLSEQDIYIGKFKPQMNCSSIDNLLLSYFSNTNWVSSEIKGNKLIIYMREGVHPDIKQINKEPADLVANKSGTIASIITRKGTPLVGEGDEVEKDDVLVTGTLLIKELEQIKAVEFTHSDADIYLNTQYDYTDKINYKYIEKEYIKENEKKDSIIKILNKEINILKPKLKDKNYDIIEKQIQLELFKNFYLPIYKYSKTYTPYNEVERSYTKEEAIDILEERLNIYMKKLEEENIQIISTDIEYAEEEDYLTATGKIFVVEKTGEIQYFDVEARRLEYTID